MKIYLASKSPRRRELLTQMGISFELLLTDTPEILVPGESPAEYSIRVTTEKLEAAWQKLNKEKLVIRPILCADTEVILDEQILGKPLSFEEAFNMIKSYSGRSHEVLTTVAIKYLDYQKVKMQTTIVSFSPISDEEIHHYLKTCEYKDKAGGYGIQSYIGQFISDIQGCFFSVMGLPLNKVRELLVDLRKHYPELV